MTLSVEPQVYWNGTLQTADSLFIPARDRAFVFGDGVYEVIRVYQGVTWLLREHLARLGRSLDRVAIANPGLELIERQILDLIQKNAVKNGTVYLQISRGSAPRAHAFPAPAVAPNIFMDASSYREAPFIHERAEGVAVILHEDARWKYRDIKSLNLLPNCIAKQAAAQAGAKEALLVEDDGLVTEGSSSNAFIVKRGAIKTAPADHRILPGVTRAFVLQLARELGISVDETPFTPAELFEADEAFLTGTAAEILPIRSVDGRAIGSKAARSVTVKLYQAMLERIAERRF